MRFSTSNWHNRYQQQASWTREMRAHLISGIDHTNFKKVLEIGCGTGAVLQDFSNLGFQQLFGLDCDFQALTFARSHIEGCRFLSGSAYHIPFTNGSFDITYCHYLLLWLEKPLSALLEMARVTKPGGYVFAFAEPDYTGRIVYPPELQKFAELQSKSLQQQGAELSIGRRLNSLFIDTGLMDIRTGIIGAEGKYESQSSSSEYLMMMNDLCKINPTFNDNQLKLLMRRKDLINFVPTFFACGRVKVD